MTGLLRHRRDSARRRAFTLVELLALLAILAILLSIFIPYLMHLRESSNRIRCTVNLKQIRDALRNYADSNDGAFPRVVYDEANQPNGYTAFTGPDDPNPFAPNSTAKPNDATASLWLLVRGEFVRDPAVFVCPSSSDSTDLLTDALGTAVKPNQRSNFRRPDNLSYGYAQPFGNAPRYKVDSNRPADFAVMADKAPSRIGHDAQSVAHNAPPREIGKINSPNHNRAGQSVLYADGSVEFKPTPYCGMGGRSGNGGDNIYTALSKQILEAGNSPAGNGTGFVGRNLSAAWWADSYLVPSADDEP